MYTVPFSVLNIFDDVDKLRAFEKLYSQVLDDHAPITSKTVWASRPPFMNKALHTAAMENTRMWKRYRSFPN